MGGTGGATSPATAATATTTASTYAPIRTVAPPTWWGPRVVAALSGAGIALWLFLLVTGAGAALHASTMARLADDLRNGGVTEYYLTDQVQGSGGKAPAAWFARTADAVPAAGQGNGATSPDGGIIVYRTVGGRWWVAAPDIDFTTTSSAAVSGTVPEVQAMVTSLTAAGVPRAPADLQRSGGAVGLPGWVGALPLALFVLVVFGPAPRRGTRWFWFWLVTIAPFGLGAVAYLAGEGILRPASTLARRRPAVVGFVVGVGSAMVVALLLWQLRRLGVDLPLT